MFVFQNRTSTLFIAASLYFSVIGAIATVARADIRDFTLHNETSVNIQELHISNSGADKWGANLLDKDVLLPDEAADIVFEDDSASCLYDIRAMTNDGEIDKRQVNLCETVDFSIAE
ncbi:hypothetical protein [Scytonema millei]|uniref:Uncharacterized protein n=1 Tax=Scytonema millei VB511283 TaxID=1245923 RepID=A0A9X5I5F6_9CYAN|nr:hypothetical protein [Scytonema millei]NHC36568.1 hypothetical protein [Scytonema millei VB511283]